MAVREMLIALIPIFFIALVGLGGVYLMAGESVLRGSASRGATIRPPFRGVTVETTLADSNGPPMQDMRFRGR